MCLKAFFSLLSLSLLLARVLSQVAACRVTWVPPHDELATASHAAATAQGQVEAQLHTHDHDAV